MWAWREEAGVSADTAEEVAVSIAVAGQPVVAGALIAVERGMRGAQCPQGVAAEQRSRVDRGGVAGQVADRGADVAGARHGAEFPWRDWLAVSVAAGDGGAGRSAADGGRRQLQRNQDPLGEKVPVRLAAGPLDDLADEQVTGTAVVPPRARLGEQRRLLDKSQALAGGHRLTRVEAGGVAPVGDPGRVGQQVVQRDLAPLREAA